MEIKKYVGYYICPSCSKYKCSHVEDCVMKEIARLEDKIPKMVQNAKYFANIENEKDYQCEINDILKYETRIKFLNEFISLI